MVIRLVEPGRAEEEQAIAALTLAFVRDPVMRWLYPDPHSYVSSFPGFARAFGEAAFAAGTTWVSDDWGGAALWFPSGVESDGEAIAGHAFSTVPEHKHEAMQSLVQELEAHHPKEPHWYLPIIGVDAAHQGKGIGAQLLQAALEQCDAEGLIAYLESTNPANVSLYQRHGFEIVGEIRAGDAPPVTPMLRPAR